jgi:lysophospholipase L1-like esterase
MGNVNRRPYFRCLIMFALTLLLAAFGMGSLYKRDYKSFYLLRINPLEDHRINQKEINKALVESEIWMLGDSRIQMWDEKLISESGSAANLGIDGQTSEQSLLRLKSYLEVETPEILIVEVGINELKIIGVERELETMILDNFYINIKAITEICQDKGIALILANIFPVGKIEITRRPVWNKSINEAIKTVNATLRTFCDNNKISYFDAYSILSENGETVNLGYQEDFLHINKLGYEVLSKSLMKQINQIRKNDL